ncbi:hypothetical protein [Candidatus Nitrotoga arctica]|uniref:hypothetical protein n=1 Tax=Candidatus Nitrotoga arctica TaxID=453162 RepID=UPI001EFA4B23|nr:hypothetical protein [Candidatus Nitrotoga arctica]
MSNNHSGKMRGGIRVIDLDDGPACRRYSYPLRISWLPSVIEDISLFVTSHELEHGLLIGIRAISIWWRPAARIHGETVRLSNRSLSCGQPSSFI